MSADAELRTALVEQTEELLRCVGDGAFEEAWAWVRERERTLLRLADAAPDARSLETARRLDAELARAARVELEALGEELGALRAQRRALERLRSLGEAGPRFLSHRA